MNIREPDVEPEKRSPCIGQAVEDIEAYYSLALIGAPAAVRQTHHGILTYDLSVVESVRSRISRITIRRFGSFYIKSGSQCWNPKSETKLVVPTDAVRKWITENPMGRTGLRVSRE